MRTTLEIEDDVILAAKQVAAQRGVSIGKVVSELLREAMEPKTRRRIRNGVPLLTPRPGVPKPSMALVNRLRDAE